MKSFAVLRGHGLYPCRNGALCGGYVLLLDGWSMVCRCDPPYPGDHRREYCRRMRILHAAQTRKTVIMILSKYV